MSHTYYYEPGGKYVLFLDLLGFTAFVRSSFPKKAEEGTLRKRVASRVGIVHVGEPEGRSRVADADPGSTTPNENEAW